ncbi:MAG: hypothetical protein E7410_07410 [Ruminococcaceae bacterium]|nr:hypothetical protein [Oscillospiraceae bacterium]
MRKIFVFSLFTLIIFALSLHPFALTDEEYNALDSDAQSIYEEGLIDGYDEAYKDGYNDGYSDAEDFYYFNSDDAYEDGYNSGYWDAYDEIGNAEDKESKKEKSLFKTILEYLYSAIVFIPWIFIIGCIIYFLIIRPIIERIRK